MRHLKTVVPATFLNGQAVRYHMAGVLKIVYAVVVAVVAIVGYWYVLRRSDDGTGEETRVSDWGTIAAVALFVVALVWATVL